MHSRTISGTAKLHRILERLDYHRYCYIIPTQDQSKDIIRQEVRLRTQVVVWAYAYEIHNDQIVSDEVFDTYARKINPAITTFNDLYDHFFQEEFSHHTGLWIHKFPTPEHLEIYYQAWKKYNKPSKLISDG
jgi:hypothetical protein